MGVKCQGICLDPHLRSITPTLHPQQQVHAIRIACGIIASEWSATLSICQVCLCISQPTRQARGTLHRNADVPIASTYYRNEALLQVIIEPIEAGLPAPLSTRRTSLCGQFEQNRDWRACSLGRLPASNSRWRVGFAERRTGVQGGQVRRSVCGLGPCRPPFAHRYHTTNQNDNRQQQSPFIACPGYGGYRQ